jgi:hypothetical protein
MLYRFGVSPGYRYELYYSYKLYNAFEIDRCDGLRERRHV